MPADLDTRPASLIPGTSSPVDIRWRRSGFLRGWLGRDKGGQTVEAAHLASSMVRRFPWRGVTFLLFVALPSIAVVVYLAFMASPQYVSESRFIVRPAVPTSNPTEGLLSSLSLSISYSSVAQNSYVVAQYIGSRAAVDDLASKIDLRAIYGRSDADFWARLPPDASHEDLVEYWRKMVKAYVDGPSSIVTVEVRAFRADDAAQIAKAILEISERLVNQMSERARRNVMRDAEEEVRRADAGLRSALTDLRDARNHEGMVDPAKSAEATGKLIGELMAERATIDGDLQLASRTLDQSSPTVRQLRSKLEIVDRQLSTLRNSLAGRESSYGNLASSLRTFERLEVQRVLADKMLTFAEENLERARIRAERQNLYFMPLVPPTVPTSATLPRRVAYSFLLPIVFGLLWGIVALTFAAVADHRI
jgi:capsular polysaccharide transport system permease protein